MFVVKTTSAAGATPETTRSHHTLVEWPVASSTQGTGLNLLGTNQLTSRGHTVSTTGTRKKVHAELSPQIELAKAGVGVERCHGGTRQVSNCCSCCRSWSDANL